MDQEQYQAKVDELNRLYQEYCRAVHNAGPFPTAFGIEGLNQSRQRARNYHPQLRAFSRYQDELEREQIPIAFIEGEFVLNI